MIATDSLSLVFVGCFVFSGAFLIATTLLGMGHGHMLHLGHAGMGHPAHIGHGHVAHVTHGAAHHPATLAPHTSATPHQGMRVQLPNSHATTTQPPDVVAATGNLAQMVVGSLNLNAILTFLFCFGLLGYLLVNMVHAGALVAVIFAILLGVVAAGALNLVLMRLIERETGSLGYDSSQMEGRIAAVSLPIRAGGLGEIIYIGENGTRRSLGARSVDGQAIARDADVVIVAYADGIATVETWDDFLLSANTTTPAQLPG